MTQVSGSKLGTWAQVCSGANQHVWRTWRSQYGKGWSRGWDTWSSVGLWGLTHCCSLQVYFLWLGCPIHRAALPAPPHSNSCTLGKMDCGDMLNYLSSVSSSRWWQRYWIFRLPRTLPDREIWSLEMQKPIWSPTIQGILRVPVIERGQKWLKFPTPPKPYNSQLLWAVGLNSRRSYTPSTWRCSDHNCYLP